MVNLFEGNKPNIDKINKKEELWMEVYDLEASKFQKITNSPIPTSLYIQ